MFIVVGLNKDHSIFESSNNKSSTSSEAVYPPVECFKKYTFPALASSISFYFDHSVFIEKNGQISVLGNNNEGQLGPYFHRSSYNTLTYSNFSQNTKFISAVVGSSYTLFMFTYEQNKNETFAYISWASSAGDENDKTHNLPIDLEVNGKPTMPAAIYGGSEKAAIIDIEGNVFVITKEPNRKIKSPIVAIPDTIIKVTRLRFANTTSFFSEKAICVACCNNFTVVLTKSGKLYGNGKINQENGRHINENDKMKGINDRNSLIEIDELKNYNIVQISGTFQHVLAVSSEGRVFGVGSNYNGQLGLGRTIKNIWRFEEIKEIYPKYRIINTSSGSGHSIFISDTGKVLTCGNNGYHQLFQTTTQGDENFYAREIENVYGNYRATFSIAGNCLSGLFLNTEPPPNQPNTPIKNNRPYLLPENLISDAFEMQKEAVFQMQSKVDSYKFFKREENCIEERSKDTQKQLKGLIECNYDEITELKKKIEEKKKIYEALKLKNKELSEKVKKLSDKEKNEKDFVGSCNDDFNDNSNDDVHFVDLKFVDEMKMIGENKFSKIFLFKKKKLFQIEFLKKCQNENLYKEQLKMFFAEYQKLSKLDHPNIIKTVGIVKENSELGIGIIQEYYENRMNIAQEENNINISKEEKFIIIFEILNLVKYLHEHQIYSTFIKPTNISILKNKHIKFHLHPQIQIQNLNENEYENENEASKEENQNDEYSYFSPDYINEEKDEKNDIYSIGILIIYLFYFFNDNKDEKGKGKEKIHPTSYEDIESILNEIEIPTNIKAVVSEMIEENPEERPTLTEIESRLHFL